MSGLNTTMEDEQFTYDYFFLDYVCRMCWRDNAVKELTSLSLKDENKTLTIAEKILESFGIDVTINKYPEKICYECLTKLEDFSVFRQKCRDNELKLSKILQQSHVIVEIGGFSKEEHQESYDDIDSNNFDCETKSEPIDRSIDYSESDRPTDLYSDGPDSDTGIIEKKKLEYSDSDSGSIEKKKVDYSESDTGSIEKKKVEKKRGVKKKTPTYCLICHTDFITKEMLDLHNLEVHGDSNGIFKCFGCAKSFSIRNRRLKHERYLCKELKLGYKCNFCQIYLPTRTIWEQHFRSHKRGDVIEIPKDLFTCKKCNKHFDSMENLVAHRKSHEEDGVKQWVCEECGRAFSRRDYFNKHKMIHTGTKEHRCPHCSFTCVQKSTLNVHLRRHTGERPYPCDMCPQRCATSSNLNEHKKRHLGIKSFECKVCSKKFGYKDSLEEHVASVHNRSESHTCGLCTASYTHFRYI